jgi:hypothetical protein
MGLLLLGCDAVRSQSDDPLSTPPTAQLVASPAAVLPEPPATGTAQARTWHDAPPCQNQPQDLTAWRSEIADYRQSEATSRQFQTYINQLRRYTPLFRDLNLDELAARLAIPDSAGGDDLRQRTLTVLWLNLMSERLNRATEITTDASGPFTLAELMNDLRQAQPGSANFEQLLALIDEVSAGHHISWPVCSRLIYRHGPLVRESLWSEQGFFDKDQALPDVPLGVTTFSPNLAHLVVETGLSDSAGGPLYLVDLNKDKVLNLNEHVSLPNYTGVTSLKVKAWHYDNHHLLLVNEDDEVAIWLDLVADEYVPLTLGLDTHQMSPPREFRLSPDGTGFTFITFNHETKYTNLHWYSLTDNDATLMTTLPITRGRLGGFSFSPTSQQAAYIVNKGRRDHGRSQELHLLDLKNRQSFVLVSGNLGPTQPVWSPDGQHIAFVRKSVDQPDLARPDAPHLLGDIWIVSTITGETTQLTFLNAIRQPPVWSPAGRILAFVTDDGQIGLVSVDEPGQAWRVETDPILPQHMKIGFVP